MSLFRVTFAVLAVVATLALRASAFEVGQTFPGLASYSLEGSAPGTKGKVVLVDLWASWCGPCQKSFPFLESLHQKLKGRGLVVVGVSLDEDPTAMQRFLKKHPASFSILRDATQALAKAAQPPTMPTSFVVDRTGKIRFVNPGFTGSSEAKIEQQVTELLGP